MLPAAALAGLLALLLLVWRLRGVVPGRALWRRVTRAACAPSPAPAVPEPACGSVTAQAAADFAARYPGYGLGGRLEAMVAADFAHLPPDETYLDHAGATLCASSQAAQHASSLLAATLGTPHSRNVAGQRTAQLMRHTRGLVLQHLNASERDYTVIFTSGCTGAVQMLAQHFRWTRGRSVLGYSLCNHNSVLGMRETAKARGCPFVCFSPEALSNLGRRGGPGSDAGNAAAGAGGGEGPDDEVLDSPRTQGGVSAPSLGDEEAVAHLFAYSLECNFSGTKCDLSLASQVQQGHLDPHMPAALHLGAALDDSARRAEGKWYVLCDAAKAAATSPVDLGGAHQPDFVALSFYKMMGLPTGLGALVVRRAAAAALDKGGFAGGSVLAVQPDEDFFRLRGSLAEALEDGSPNFHAILAAAQGLERLRALGMRSIADHTWALRDYLARELSALRHAAGGAALVEVYGPPPGAGAEAVGSIVAFNLRRPDGRYVEYSQVEELAALSHSSLLMCVYV